MEFETEIEDKACNLAQSKTGELGREYQQYEGGNATRSEVAFRHRQGVNLKGSNVLHFRRSGTSVRANLALIGPLQPIGVESAVCPFPRVFRYRTRSGFFVASTVPGI